MQFVKKVSSLEGKADIAYGDGWSEYLYSEDSDWSVKVEQFDKMLAKGKASQKGKVQARRANHTHPGS